jgi:hypothetical protein
MHAANRAARAANCRRRTGLADLVRGVAITNLAAPQQIAYVFARPTDNAGISVRTGSISIPRVSGSTSPIRW